ncbi:MAG TPA: type II secretion system major pseudopilin GspG [Acidobacteriota bacterium]|nr:type II secretion system major pseudopilin GspG [Acidobacteriota bacterium]
MILKSDDRKSEKGMTLMELMVVIVILGLLAGVAGFYVVKQFGKAKDKVVLVQIAEIEQALEKFAFDTGRFPNTDEGLDALLRNPGNFDSWEGPYLKKAPPNDPWGKPYAYRCPSTHGLDYDLYSFGPDGIDGNEDDIGNWK